MTESTLSPPPPLPPHLHERSQDKPTSTSQTSAAIHHTPSAIKKAAYLLIFQLYPRLIKGRGNPVSCTLSPLFHIYTHISLTQTEDGKGRAATRAVSWCVLKARSGCDTRIGERGSQRQEHRFQARGISKGKNEKKSRK